MVQTLVAVVVLAVLVLLLFLHSRGGGSKRRPAPGPSVTLDDLDRIHELLTETPEDDRFAVLLFGANGQPPDPMDALNVQLSIEERRTGLDWDLLAPPNLEARDRVVAFLRAHGYEPEEYDRNEARYLRVEGGDLVAVCRKLLTELFGVTPTQKMVLLTGGFEWTG